ncbi:MAG: glycosyltransferase family 2 protein, partial [Planctomycetes bacterium]|nr:glycosyltransferase family 2 protein [Planctomycetota bacterium]
LSPLGYKIGLELLIKGRCRKLLDVPILFADRHAGKSKLTFRQQLLYLIHLKRLYFFKFPPWSALVFYGLPLLLVGGALWMLAT